MSLEAAVDNLAKVADDLVDRLDVIAEILKSVHALQLDAFGIALQRDKLHEFAAGMPASPPPPPPANPVALDYAKDVQPALLRLAAKKGRQALVDLLKAHGVNQGADLPAASYAAVVVAATDLTEAAS